MTEQTKVHYTVQEIFDAFFPEYTSLPHFRRVVLPRLLDTGFPRPATYSSPRRLFFCKAEVDSYFRPAADPQDAGSAPAAIDWSAEAIRRAAEGGG